MLGMQVGVLLTSFSFIHMDVPMYGCMYVGTYSYDQQLVHTVTMNNWFVQSRWTNGSYSYDGQMAC